MSEEKIRLTFLGGATDIGASCCLIEIGTTNLIIDSGIKLEGKSILPDFSLLNEKKIDAILITHAHIDHTGALPVLSESFPTVPIYATPPTIDIIKILLYDSIKIMLTEREGEIPIYGIKQIQNLFNNIKPINFYNTFLINDVEVTFLPAGHIIGASMIHLSSKIGNILFTGDYSVSVQATVPALSIPSLRVDCLITESTYGSRFHENRTIAEQRLINKIQEILSDEGIALIPCFAVGRAQEILIILLKAFRQHNLPKIPVYVDGMVNPVCNIYKNYENYLTRWLAKEIKKQPHPFYQNNIQPVLNPQERNKIISKPPAIIIASSGMLNGGASVYYAKFISSNEKNAILITGYQDEESPGKALLNLAEKSNDKFINLGGEQIEIKCKIEKYGLSAHADKLQIISFIESIKPEKIILNHGDDESKISLSNSLLDYDTTQAYDGLSIEFTLQRKHKKYKSITLPINLDKKNIENIRSLLGTTLNKPISASQIAKKIFGDMTNPYLINMLAEWLENLKIVRRDDKHRTMLWILHPSEIQSAETESEIGLIKKENPKGKLLEMCARLKIDDPIIKTNKIGNMYKTTISLNYFGEIINSRTHYAESEKLSEHKASLELIKLIEEKQSLNKDDVIIVNNEDAENLKTINPKGKLLEWCQANKIKLPTFEKRITSDGYNIKAIIKNNDDLIESKWYAHPILKISEHAACYELLSICNKTNLQTTNTNKQKEKNDINLNTDPISILNHLKQTKKILDFDLSQISQTGPPHLPTFIIIGFIILANGEKISTQPLQAHSKKEAQKLAATQLLELIKL